MDVSQQQQDISMWVILLKYYKGMNLLFFTSTLLSRMTFEFSRQKVIIYVMKKLKVIFYY